MREGRRREFAAFSAFHGDEASLKQVPDPNAESTFLASRLDWDCISTERGRYWLGHYKQLLRIRAERVVPLLSGAHGNCGKFTANDDGVIWIEWKLNSGVLRMALNLDDDTRAAPTAGGETIYATNDAIDRNLAANGELPAHSIVVAIERNHQALRTI